MTCMAICADPFPGEAAWLCEKAEGHHGAHSEGRVMWSSHGSQVADRHDVTSGGEH